MPTGATDKIELNSFSEIFRSPAGQIWEHTLLDEPELRTLNKEISAAAEALDPKAISLTLGAALYRHSNREDLPVYLESANSFRAGLFRELSWLYDRLRANLEKFLGAPVSFHAQLSPPGFLILRNNITQASKPHYDFQARLLPYEITRDYDLNKILTFTLAVEMPGSGSGLYYWPFTFKELVTPRLSPKALTDAETRELILLGFSSERVEDISFFNFLKNYPRHYLPYRPGQLYLTVGGLFHQAGPLDNLTGADRRVTLQGHALFSKNGGWELYW